MTIGEVIVGITIGMVTALTKVFAVIRSEKIRSVTSVEEMMAIGAVMIVEVATRMIGEGEMIAMRSVVRTGSESTTVNAITGQGQVTTSATTLSVTGEASAQSKATRVAMKSPKAQVEETTVSTVTQGQASTHAPSRVSIVSLEARVEVEEVEGAVAPRSEVAVEVDHPIVVDALAQAVAEARTQRSLRTPTRFK